MNKKVYALIGGLTTAVAGAAIALVTYFEPAAASAINAAIEVAAGAVMTICGLFASGTDKK